MSAKRRNRKNQSKRSKSDVDPYTQRYRQASDGAKAARDAARRRAESRSAEGEDREVHVIREAKLRSVSLVEEPGPYGGTIEFVESKAVDHEAWLAEQVEKAEDDPGLRVRSVNVNHEGFGVVVSTKAGGEEALRPQGAPDAASLVERIAPSSEGLPPAEQVAEPQGRAAAEARTFFEEVDDVRELADAANGPLEVLAAVIEAKERAEAEYARRHYVFFEAEVNGLPTHVGGCQCYCELGANHWKELGEI